MIFSRRREIKSHWSLWLDRTPVVWPGADAPNCSQEPKQMLSLRPPSFFCKNSLDKLHKYLLCDINTPNLLPAAAFLRWWVEKQERSIRQRCAWRWKGHHTLTPTSTSLSRFPGLSFYFHIQQFCVSLLLVFVHWIFLWLLVLDQSRWSFKCNFTWSHWFIFPPTLWKGHSSFSFGFTVAVCHKRTLVLCKAHHSQFGQSVICPAG